MLTKLRRKMEEHSENFNKELKIYKITNESNRNTITEMKTT